MDLPSESHFFGIYDTTAALWDQIVFDAPYYLPVKSSGNDRNDGAPSNGTTFYRFQGAGWAEETYDDTMHPGDDGAPAGYDTVSANGNAKNILTVGAVNDAVSGGVRSLANATMSSFSGWGPTDDGRVKPDVVGNGVALFSSGSANDSAYSTLSGTSMSAPNVTGSATLLQEYYRNYTGEGMAASTIKALLIHTADDLGNPGPDYSFGWGLVNTYAGMAQLTAAEIQPSEPFMTYMDLADQATYSVNVTAAGGMPLKATLVWTDPPGAATDPEEIDDPTIKLVNDLDLEILPAMARGVEFLPWVLDPDNPADPATTGDNIRDNVEQVIVDSPVGGDTYTVRVSHKGVLLDTDPQAFSLIISGMPVVLFENGFD
ncbi:MAG: hypothetical protein DHS20C11_21190 [Lysobacteraceae bacterium]|nr:MAG: hypothetical protein DHS20C11_21190 [Xanthomonadaceae bacterium]